MKFDELFEQRNFIAMELKKCIRDKGYTKVSFAEKADISRATLEKLLNAEINSKSAFGYYLQKILKMLNMTINELLLYHMESTQNMETVYSKKTLIDYEMSDRAKKEYELLLDGIELCSVYY